MIPETGEIERCIHALWREFSHAFREARSVGRRDGAQLAHVVMILCARRADYCYPAQTCELEDGRTDPTSGSAHQERLTGFNAHFVKGARCRVGDHCEAASNFERHIIRLVSPVCEDRILGHGIRVFAAAEDGVSDGNAGNAGADLVHNARRFDADTGRKCNLLELAVLPGQTFPVRGLTPAARTAIRTWPGPACGSSTSTTCRTSGLPYSLN